MSNNPLYNLTWGEYGTSLVSAVQLLRCHGELVDVTLAAGGRTFHAHKVVLCAASPFLLDLLKSTTCKHPVVMLAGVQASDLEALLEFVYRGEVSIDPNQLPSLLQAAHCLNIQGLAPSSMPLGSETQQSVKTVMDIPKVSEIMQTQSGTSSLHCDEVPIKRRKRARKFAKSPPVNTHTKWPKLYLQTEANENIILGSPQDANTATWTPQINLVNVSASTSKIDSLPVHSSVLVHNIPVSGDGTPIHANSVCNATGPKIRGASDQPGACPLCGAMLRQARNLRRHLLTSCKYRMVNESQQSAGSSQLDRSEGTSIHEMQTVSMQNIDRIAHSAELLEIKPVALTTISCTDVIPSSSIINMTSSIQ